MKTNLLVSMLSIVGLASLSALGDEPARPKFNVKIQDDKAVVVEVDGSGAVDPTQRIRLQSPGNFQIQINTMQGQILQLSHFPNFMINGRFTMPGNGGRLDRPVALGKTPNGKTRVGFSTHWSVDNSLQITQTLEVVPAKAKKPGEKRLMNTVMVNYLLENKGTQSQNVGVRTYMDTYVIDNDGCMFAAPTIPNKVLDGMILEGKTLPPSCKCYSAPISRTPCLCRI